MCKKGKHLQKHPKRELVNAVRYLTKQADTGVCYPKNTTAINVHLFYTRAIKRFMGRNDRPTGSKRKTVSASEGRGLMVEKNQRPQPTPNC